MKKIAVINGPNLNMLGQREVSVYGEKTLAEINQIIEDKAKEMDAQVDFFTSNVEGEIVGAIHRYILECDGIILNAGAYTHYSYAIRDAIAMAKIPIIEVHLSNVHSREEFRHTSYIRAACTATIRGHGLAGYVEALRLLCGTQASAPI